MPSNDTFNAINDNNIPFYAITINNTTTNAAITTVIVIFTFTDTAAGTFTSANDIQDG